jgi:quercetin 2,3-dioxygenase
VVLEGLLVSRDSTGRRSELGPGSVLRLTTGDGVRHEERAGELRTRFVQAHVLSRGGPASSQVLQAHDGLVVDAGPARLHLLRSPASLPDAARVHVFAARGGAHLDRAGRLEQGDAVRLTGAGERALLPDDGGEVLVWELPGGT